MFYKEFSPVEELKDIVKLFWVMDKDYSPENYSEKVTPDGLIEVIFQYKDVYKIRESQSVSQLPQAFFIGLFDHVVPLEADSNLKLIAARLYPWGAYKLFNRPMNLFTNKVINLKDVYNSDEVDRLLESLSFVDFNYSVNTLNRFLIDKLSNSTNKDVFSTEPAKYILEKAGAVNIDEMARKFNLSGRHQLRLFEQQIGMSPKRFSRIVRFNTAVNMMLFHPGIELTDLAFKLGHTDQSHFNKNFKEFTGKTPGEYLEHIKELHRVMDQDNVSFLSPKDTV